MSRYVNNIPSPLNPEYIYQMVGSILQSEGFEYVTYKGENVWKKGSGFLTAPQFMSVVCHDGMVTVQAWIKQALLPGVYVGEMGLTGFYGVAIKEMLKGRVARVETAIGTENQRFYNSQQMAASAPEWPQ